MSKEYTLEELENLPTIATGQANDLKIHKGNIKIWLSRCTVEDGEPYNNKVTVEALINGRWEDVETYQAK